MREAIRAFVNEAREGAMTTEEINRHGVFIMHLYNCENRTLGQLQEMLFNDIQDLFIVYLDERAATDTHNRHDPHRHTMIDVQNMIVVVICGAKELGVRLSEEQLRRFEGAKLGGVFDFVELVKEIYQNPAGSQRQEPPTASTAAKPYQPQQLPDILNKPQAQRVFADGIKKGLISNDGELYKWNGTAALYGYFVDQVSKVLKLKLHLGGLMETGRIQWKFFKQAFTNHDKLIAGAQKAVNDYKNNEEKKPIGYDKVDKIIKL